MTGEPTNRPIGVELAEAAGDHGRIERRLLELLVCPLTKSTLIYDAERQELISRAAGLAYPIVDGMPVLVAREARPLDIQEDPGT